MFFIRTTFWLGIIVMLMPTDREAQTRLTAVVGSGINQAATYCDRHQMVCDNGAAVWAVVKTKAEIAGRMAYELAMERMGPQPYAQPTVVPPTGPLPRDLTVRPVRTRHIPQDETARVDSQGTLNGDDTAPAWRGELARRRL